MSDRSETALKQHQFKPGQSGNPGGRPKARGNLEAEFINDLYASWQKSGKDAITRMIARSPGDYVRMVCGLLPRDVNFKEQPLDGARLDRLIAVLDQRIAELQGPAGREETAMAESESVN